MPAMARRAAAGSNPPDVVMSMGGSFQLHGAIKSVIPLKLDEHWEAYSPVEAESAIQKLQPKYQDVNTLLSLDHGPRMCRQGTFSVIEKYIIGESVLDVGCAEGLFCFLIEGMSLRQVVGIDIKKERLLIALAIKQIRKSKCEFNLSSISEMNKDVKYDTILLLNVIHHLPNPFKVLGDLAEICRDRLIIEFPTLNDKKFGASISDAPELDHLPLIGVSLLASQDQTFVFTQSAISRLLVDNNNWFTRIDFIGSPYSPERKIAICYK